jgi:hypothetical protein
MPGVSHGLKNRPGAEAVLVIGLHREELRFGEQVAKRLPRTQIDLLRIEHGLSAKKPLYHQRFYYTTEHREIYLQLRRHIQPQHRLLIDLHAGVGEGLPRAEVYCHDLGLLDRLASRLAAPSAACHAYREQVRLVRIVTEEAEPALRHERPAVDPDRPGYTVCRTLIPEAVWRNERFCYVGVEVYLRKPQTGEKRDWELGRELIAILVDCV